MIIDRKGLLVTMNMHAVQLFNRHYKPGTDLLSLFANAGPLIDGIRRAWSRRASVAAYDQHLTLPDGRKLAVDFLISGQGNDHQRNNDAHDETTHQDEEGEHTVLVFIARPGAQHQILEGVKPGAHKQLRLAAEMSAILAHEVKNPLAAIRGAAQLLGGMIGAQADDMARLICDETDRITRLLGRLEHCALPYKLVLQPVNVHQPLIQARRAILADDRYDIRIVECYDPSLPEARADGDCLVQVLTNLLVNAAQALAHDRDHDGKHGRVGHGGVIELKTSYVHGWRLGGSDWSGFADQSIRIDIIDNGPGIDPKVKGRMFEPRVGTTSAQAGKGLGLAIAAALVDRMNGAITWQSRPGRTIFSVFLTEHRHQLGTTQ